MARKPRIFAVFLVPIAGIAWSLPLQTGSIEVEPETPAYLATVPPEFEVATRRELLTITGHTKSASHEERLKQVAAELFPDQAVRFTFRPLGVAPDWWDGATAELIMAAAAMQSPRAKLRGKSLQVRGVVANKSAAEQQMESLRTALPDTTNMDIRLTEVESGMPARAFCDRQFAALDPGPVRFEESGTVLRASAFPALDRIVALADACRHSTVSITGHTDASGNEEWNRQLSLARARAVADYLGTRGIRRERLLVVGAGSSLPIADNTTRFGRALNRRIDIRLSPKG